MYSGQNGITKSTIVKNKGQEMHSAVFAIEDFVPNGSLPGGADFRIVREEDGECVISFVRIIKD